VRHHVIVEGVVDVVFHELSIIAFVAPRHCSHKSRYICRSGGG
jgi:hypothetical protein